MYYIRNIGMTKLVQKSWLLIVTLLLIGCRDKDAINDSDILSEYLDLPATPYQYANQEVPTYLDSDLIKQQDNTPGDNATSNWGATLGRVLFYDKLLSKNNTIACGFCHKQAYGFSDTVRFSKGFEGGETKRHSMGLSNARYRVSGLFFWDGRAETLEDQVLMPIQDPTEMGLTISELITRVANQPYYEVLFKKAFGNETVTEDRISKALAQFVRSIQSFQSRYDQGRSSFDKTEDFSNFSAVENLGKKLFFDLKKGNCGGCHYTDAFVMDVPRNNGLDVWESTNDKDIGYEATTSNSADRGAFIAPSLRNIALRPPYMHDGRFTSLEAVVDHYSDNIRWSPTLDNHLKGSDPNTAVRFNLTDQEKQALIAFLTTLTDDDIITDKRFSNPF
ncbi:MAG: cytochrome c peroxidase [Bacteroidia bacterium]|jgi:cytochrome c peroxidase